MQATRRRASWYLGDFTLFGSFSGAATSNTELVLYSPDGSACAPGTQHYQLAVFWMQPSSVWCVTYASSSQINFLLNNAPAGFRVPTYQTDRYSLSLYVLVNGQPSNTVPTQLANQDAALFQCAAGSPLIQQYPSYNLAGGWGYPPISQSSGPPILTLYANALTNFGRRRPAAFPARLRSRAPGTVLYCDGVDASPGLYQINIHTADTT